MGLTAGTPLRDITVDTVFVGSCTNGRIRGLRAVAKVIEDVESLNGVRMLVVPGSMRVRAQPSTKADAIFTAAGAEWRQAGWLDVLGMTPTSLPGGAAAHPRPTATSRDGKVKADARHLVSPLVAAATAVTGHLASPADL